MKKEDVSIYSKQLERFARIDILEKQMFLSNHFEDKGSFVEAKEQYEKEFKDMAETHLMYMAKKYLSEDFVKENMKDFPKRKEQFINEIRNA